MIEALTVMHTIGSPVPRDSRPTTEDLVIIRLQNLGREIGANVGRGLEGRKPAEEAARAGAAIGDLPPPSKPPNR